jgi:HlyD family secretion protein
MTGRGNSSLRSIQGHLVVCALVALSLVLGLAGWGGTVALNGAVIAKGLVVVDSNVKKVQHPDGGVIHDILVRNGDTVTQGQVLVQLDSSDARADLQAIRGQIGALEAEIETSQKQLPTIEEQLSDLRSLYSKGLTRKPHLLELEREATKLKGDIVANKSRLDGLYEQARKAEAKVRRENVTAPLDGVVMDLRVHTRGGVIGAGEIIMVIVPRDDDLSIEAKVSPNDIDELSPDQSALLRFSAFNMRTTPELNGTVDWIAADLTEDERTGIPFYKMRISVSDAEVARLRGLELKPGLPVEVFVQTGSRTMLSYLLKPLMDQVTRAFRET